MTRTTIDDRLHRVCAIMIGMTTIAAVVGVVTIAIHDRSIDSEKPLDSSLPLPAVVAARGKAHG
jgi:hypothetical protein